MNIVTGYDMQYTQQQRLAPEAPDESSLYGPIGEVLLYRSLSRWFESASAKPN